MMKYILGVAIVILVSLVVVSLNNGAELPYAESSPEISSPKDRIKESQIMIYDDKVVIEIDKPMWAGFSDTNSMDPLIDFGANSIEIIPNGPDDIEVGDVISYYLGDSLIVHRVIEVSEDEFGIFYKVKGDNNSLSDPNKVRYEQVHGVLVGVIY